MNAAGEAFKENETRFRDINREARSNPHSPYAGKWIGMLGGEIVAIADDAEETLAKLRGIAPDPTSGLVFFGNGDYDTTDFIWSA